MNNVMDSVIPATAGIQSRLQGLRNMRLWIPAFAGMTWRLFRAKPVNLAPVSGVGITRKLAGFTLIELVVTVAIVGILASALVPLGQLNVQRVKEAELRTALRDIRGALDAYKKAWDEGHIEKRVDESGYPPSLDILAQGVPDVKDPKKKMMRFLRRVPRDPMYPDSSADPEDTWGKRSYESPPDAPQAGADVYDVYSLSNESGLNGIAYRNW